jgi:hypothetical protein
VLDAGELGWNGLIIGDRGVGIGARGDRD